jgi:aspartate dehydrogenase
MRLVAICDVDERKTAALKKVLKKNIPILEIDALIKSADLVVEAASAKVSAGIVKKAIRKRKDVLVMSVGGLVGEEGLLDLARKKSVRVYIPSGAICGIDGLKASSFGRIDSVTITTRKPPRGLEGAPYLVKNGIDVSCVKDETVIFEGNAEAAIKGFPQNVNVCATLSLAGIGAGRTSVRIVTSPHYTRNTHEVEIKGDFGVITTRTDNAPSSRNPKTSALAILSAIASLAGVSDSVRIGT